MARVKLDAEIDEVDDEDIEWGDEGAPEGFPDEEDGEPVITAARQEGMKEFTERSRRLREELEFEATKLQFDYSQIDGASRPHIMAAAVTIHTEGVKAKQSIVKIGRQLALAKDLLPHGQFGE